MNDNVPFNRSTLAAAFAGSQSRPRTVGGGETAAWPTADGGTIVDLEPQKFLARLTGARIGSAYGWERVFVSANVLGQIGIELAANGDANSGTPTQLPAIEPNGITDLLPGSIVLLWPVDQGGTWQYVIIAVGGGQRGGFPYPYSSGYYTVLDSIVIPIRRYRCEGNNLQELTEWWLVSAPGITAVVYDTNPNADGVFESGWYCVGGECIESTVPPDGYNSGPYATQEECAANCV